MKPGIRPAPPAAALTPELHGRLDAYGKLLLRWTARINLIAAGSAAALQTRHIEDSLQLVPLLPADGAIADLGSGAGLPGLVLACVLPERTVHLIEADRRKAAFLADAAGRLGLTAVRIHPRRIEQLDPMPELAVVTARALAPLPDLLGHAHRLLAPGGVAVFPKGREAEQELTAAQRHWHMAVERFQSRTDPAATIFRISEIRRAAE